MLNPNDPNEVARAIAGMMEMLEEQTDVYRHDIEEAAKSGAAFKKAHAESYLAIIAAPMSSKMTAPEREARVEVEVNGDRVIADVYEARAKATKEALNSLRVQLDSARSLGANLRSMT
jgi:predicted metal-dependent phosphoesterase TrpH